MDFWKWLLLSFNGRISRKYYWYTFLLFFVLQMIYMAVFFGTNMSAMQSGDISAMSPIAWICALPLAIVYIWMGLAVSIKRWHDRGKSGWWILIGFIPLIGGIWVLVECGFLSGAPGSNQYGISNQLPTDPFHGQGTPDAPLQHPVVQDPPSTAPAPPAQEPNQPNDANPNSQ